MARATAASISAAPGAGMPIMVRTFERALGSAAGIPADGGPSALVDEALVDEALVDEALVDEALVDEALVDEALASPPSDAPAASGEAAPTGAAAIPSMVFTGRRGADGAVAEFVSGMLRASLSGAPTDVGNAAPQRLQNAASSVFA